MQNRGRASAAVCALVLSAGLVGCGGDGAEERGDTPGIDTGVDPAERDGTGGEIDPGTDVVDPTPS